MHAGILVTWKSWKRGFGVFQTTWTLFFGLGMFLGIISVSMWQQWSLTFGQDPQILLAVSLVLSLAFWLGQRWQVSRAANSDSLSLASLVFCLAAWSILHPFWIDSLTTFMGFVPLSTLENSALQPFVAMTLAALGWTIPGMLWSAVIARGGMQANRLTLSKRRTFAVMLCGIASGLLTNSLVFAPCCGVYIPSVATSALASIAGWWLTRDAGTWGKQPSKSQPLNSYGVSTATLIRAVMACVVGALLACNLRLANQLLPHSFFVIYVQVAGVLLGIASGLGLASFRRFASDKPSWGGLLAAATASVLLAVQPLLVDVSLWLNTSLITVALLLIGRSVLLMSIAFPFGLSLAWIADGIDDDADSNLVAWGMPFAAGMGAAIFLLSGIVGLIPLMSACNGTLIFAAGFMYLRSSGWVFSFRTTAAMTCLVAAAVSLPVWSTCDDASRAAKILYSTPAFIAYRSGWAIEQLTHLDDIRMIERHEGRTGPLTLWRGRVAELYLREAGNPLAIVTKNSEIVPQFPAEVLQVVYPLVLSERPGRLLFLGLSSGVSLSTCLSFPIREAVCVEDDDNLINMVRGPLSRETGFDPLNDDRVKLRRISPELALMAQEPEPFDVIVSSPLNSSLTDGSASFTQEFYQRAAHQLADHGLFCQRLECIDYGPEPIQLVIKSIRKAFRQVIAIEMSAGELLLIATNSEDAILPDNLAARLESSHLCGVLARSGLDWSALLNFPAYDSAALEEICNESPRSANSTLHGQLAACAPLELMRWGNKQLEVQTILTATRSSPAPYWTGDHGQPKPLEEEIHLSRRSRLIEWMDDAQSSQELVRRLQEIVEQQKLVRENPDAHWWAYRKVLKKQLQDRPRTAVQQVKAVDEKRTLHPEDVHRKEYFVALGNAARQQHPTREQVAEIEKLFEPYDPFISYFGRQETADLLARCGEDAAQELAYRLYVIYYAPTVDASVRNVSKALVLLTDHPETIPNDSIRYDALNGLIQTLRIRWEIRQNVKESSSKKILDDVDQSLVAVEKGVAALDSLSAAAGVTERDWQTRKNVIDRLMLRPLRTYRSDVQLRQIRGQAKARSIIEEAGQADENEDL